MELAGSGWASADVAVKDADSPMRGAALRSLLAEAGPLGTDVSALQMALPGVAADEAKLGAAHALVSELLLHITRPTLSPAVPSLPPLPFLSAPARTALASCAPHAALVPGDVLHAPLAASERVLLASLPTPDTAAALLPGRGAADLVRATADPAPASPVLRFERRGPCRRYFRTAPSLARLCAAPTRARPAGALAGERVRRLAVSSEALEGHGEVSYVALDRAGARALVTCCKAPAEATLYDLRRGTCRPLPGHDTTVSDCAFAADDSLAFTAGHDAAVRVWEPASGALLHTLARHTDSVLLVAPHPHNAALLASAGSDATLHLWDAARGKHLSALHSLPGVALTGAAAQLTFMRQAGRADVLVAGLDCDASASAGLLFLQVSGPGARPLRAFHEHRACIGAVAVAPHTDGLVLSGSSRLLLLNDLRAPAAVRRLPVAQGDVHVAAFSPCERFLASGGDDNTALVFDVRFGAQPLHVLSHDLCGDRGRAHSQGVMAVAWLGAHLLSAGEDGAVRVWEVLSGTAHVAKSEAHSAPVSAMAVAADGDVLLTGADDAKAALHTLPGDPRRLPSPVEAPPLR